MKADERLIFRLPKADKEAFDQKLKEEGKRASEVLISFIRQYVETPSDFSEMDRIKQELEELRELKPRLEKLEVMAGELHA